MSVNRNIVQHFVTTRVGMNQLTNKDKILEFIRKKGIVGAKDFPSIAGARVYLNRLVESGDVERISRGLYAAAETTPTANRTLAQASRGIPKGIVCLLSALRFHGLTTQLPSEVWIAIDGKARTPKEQQLPIRIVRFSGPALSDGVETHVIENVNVPVYGVAKTVADCFKYRNKIGIDVALEALRDSQNENKCTVDEIWHFARVCRVARVIQPYLEATV